MMQHTRVKRISFVLIMFCWTAVIFSFSLQPANVSSGVSQGMGQWIVGMFLPGMENRFAGLNVQTLDFFHFLLRKCAHFTEYFILGMLAFSVFDVSIRRKRWRNAALYCVAVASVDETIQLFVDGRAGRITDVLLDSTGAMMGIFFCILIIRGWRRLL